MTPQDVINGLQSPEELLRHCMLAIAGGGGQAPPNGQAAIATFLVAMDPTAKVKGFTTGASGALGIQKQREFASLTKLPGVAKVAPAANEFNAYYVPMAQMDDVWNGSSHYVLPSAGGPDVMITSRLSGCRFAVGSDANGAVLVSHVQPSKAINEGLRQGSLAGVVSGGFAQQGGTQTASFAMEQDYAKGDKAAVIGLRNGGTWHFYLQAQGFEGESNRIRNVTVV
jgi:hypothetical protein